MLLNKVLMAQKELVRVSVRNDLGILVLDSNDHNTLTGETILEIGRKFGELEGSSEVKAIVFTGYPKSFFSVGADVKEIMSLVKGGDKTAAGEAIKQLQAVYLRIDKCAKPTIAAINGYCLGGGLELALACDFRIAGKEAILGLPEVDLGIIPGLGGTQRLPRLVSLQNAARIVLGGKKAMSGAGAMKDIGLVDEIIEGDFIVGVKSFAAGVLDGKSGSRSRPIPAGGESLDGYLSEDRAQALVAEKAESAVKTAVRALVQGLQGSLEEGLDLERSLFLEQAFSPDGIEGLTAFAEKR
ncbi:MAG: enoyl-CoA hydratase/isomerase family protein, partial [bacterium]|nr:enoyl-CoA hydratase/isomerase family protein [bacterium]